MNNTLAPARRPSFGIMTAPSQVAYDDVLRVWREADSIPEIEHAWLFTTSCRSSATRTGPPSRAGHCCRP